MREDLRIRAALPRAACEGAVLGRQLYRGILAERGMREGTLPLFASAGSVGSTRSCAARASMALSSAHLGSGDSSEDMQRRA